MPGVDSISPGGGSDSPTGGNEPGKRGGSDAKENASPTKRKRTKTTEIVLPNAPKEGETRRVLAITWFRDSTGRPKWSCTWVELTHIWGVPLAGGLLL